MAEITIEQLMERTEAIKKKLALAAEASVEQITEIAKELEKEARELEELGEAYRAQEMKKVGRKGAGKLEVVLTPDQKKRIHEKTGILLETIVIEDKSGAIVQSMPRQVPETIERMAMAEAMRRKVQAEAAEEMRAELERTIAIIEASGNPELIAQLEKAKSDPNFLALLAPPK